MPSSRSETAPPGEDTATINDPSESLDTNRAPPSPAADTTFTAVRQVGGGQVSDRSSATPSIARESFRSAGYNELGQQPSSLHTSSSPSVSPPISRPPSSSAADLSNSSSPFNSSSSRAEGNLGGADVPLHNLPKPPPIPLSSPAPRRPKHSGGSQTAGTVAAWSQIPRTLSDLGRDYSRYPPPTQQSSVSIATTPLPQYSGMGTPTTTKSQFPPSSLREITLQDITQIGYVVDPEKKSVWLLDDRLASATFPGDAGHNCLVYIDEKEADDDLHTPRSDDDLKLKPKFKDFCQPRQLASMFGLLFLLLGLFSVFILLPVLSYTGHAIYSYPSFSPGFNDTAPLVSAADHVNDVKYPLFRNIRYSLIDPHTPSSVKTRKSFDGEELQLVFSDEFKTPNRTFYPGDDPFWTAQDLWYGSTQDLEWYDPDAVTTADGTLKIRLDQFPNHGLNYRSGMLNSWNQVCMQGGLLEVSVSLPGPGGAAGLWPGAWTMGNLGRPGYKASTEGLWPYTYNSCDAGITPNQSMTDGTSYLPGQKLPSCTCPGEDHPTPGTGRGAPEIDVFEASADPNLKLGIITQSYQVAPFDIWYHPNYDHFAIPNYNLTQMNGYCGGPFQQAVSAQTELNNHWYDGKLYQKYGFDYTPGSLSDGKIAWFVGDDISFMINGNSVGPNGNVDTRPITNEPMAMVLNLGFSTAWTGINYDELRFPTTMYVDYVRWYQRPGQQSVTCDPPGYETTKYIHSHANAYHNNNLTLWNQTGYSWPKHKLNTEC